MRRRFIGSALCLPCLVGVLLLAGCASSSSSGTTPSPTPSVGTPGDRLTGTIAVTGSLTATSDFSSKMMTGASGTPTEAPASTTCSDYAKGYQQTAASGGGTGFYAPSGKTGGSDPMGFSAFVSLGYSGPGTYHGPVAAGEVIVHTYTPNQVIFSTSVVSTTDITMVVMPDGSGTITFTDLMARGGNKISATVKWTCH